jgi:serine/threonine-protein kinase
VALGPGTRVGVYEILSLLGSGGMGEVYRARDVKLQRDVAIKVLPQALHDDPERLARFEREAKTLAALSHPNIAHVHGFDDSTGVAALVMELVEGPTVADRIARGPIPLDEALAIAKQIADGLEAAHEQGIIHRDLKPANIKVRDDGTVKILDFGLAKALEPKQPSGVNVTQSPTITTPAMMTGVGVILGTAAYMSPEQVRGLPADKRTDVWAFGCVLYEMLTGQRAFVGEHVSDVMAGILRAEPNWNALPTVVSSMVRAVLHGCLNKNRRERIGDFSTVRFLFGQQLPEAAAQRRPKALPLVLGAIAVLAGALITVMATRMRRDDTAAITRFEIQLPGENSAPYASPVLALARDGRRLAFISNQHLYIRRLDRLDMESIPGTDGAAAPLFSPDGQWVAFWQAGLLKRVPVTGGPSMTICEMPRSTETGVNSFAGSWGDDDRIVFTSGGNEVWRVSASGGKAEALIALKPGETAFGPQVLPDHQRVLFTLNPGGLWDRAQIVVQRLDTGARQVVVPAGHDGRYLPTGHLLFATSTTVMGAPFDVATGQLTATAVPLVEGVRAAPTLSTGVSHFAVSQNGTFVYVTATTIEPRTLVWVDRTGHETPLPAPPHAYRYPRLSPDGSRIAVEAEDGDNDIWIWEVGRATLTRLTQTPESELSPLWSPDGRYVWFQSTRQGAANIFRQLADGTHEAERLTTDPSRQLPDAFTPDGKVLVFRTLDTSNRYDLLVMTTDAGARPKPLIQTRFNEQNADLSPNGRWIVYQSDDSGQVEVYVRPFPNVEDGRWIVSSGGGHRPVWARTGREIFYRSSEGAMMSVSIREQPTTLTIGPPARLFDGPSYYGGKPGLVGGNPGRHFDVTADGQRFLMVKEAPRRSDSARVVVIENWSEELKARVPVK